MDNSWYNRLIRKHLQGDYGLDTISNKQQATSNKQQGNFYLFSTCEKAPSVCKGGVF